MASRILDLRNTKTETSSSEPRSETITHSAHEKELQWQTLEFPEVRRDQQHWIRTILLIAIPLLAIFLFLKNILGAVLVVLGSATLLLEAFRKPRSLTYSINVQGVTINAKQYAYEEFKAFSFLAEPPERKEISLHSKKTLGQRVSLVLGPMNAQTVCDVLKQHLPEEEYRLSPFELWLRKHGF